VDRAGAFVLGKTGRLLTDALVLPSNPPPLSRTGTITLLPEEALHDETLSDIIRKREAIAPYDAVVVRRRSIDARGKRTQVHVSFEVYEKGENSDLIRFNLDLPDVSNAPEVHIIGAGPAGLFAAIRLIEDGFRPILIERGKDVRARRRDIAAINKDQVVNPESNYCFGEGGAGTYSDGKLYTRSVKRGDVRRILEILHVHGAKESVLFDAHPHIGTNKLPGIISAMRETILRCGGKVHFETRVADIVISSGKVTALITGAGERIAVSSVILATGHSARDIFHLLHRNGIEIHAKPFALGVRVEHSQELIDRVQYHCATDRGPVLPAAAYSVVEQVRTAGKERGVFSFCMCPGGFIVPSATAPGEIVVNGMSPSRRDSRYANSGIVVAVDESDFLPYAKHGPLAGLHFQAAAEQRAFTTGQLAPAQRLEDFIQGRISATLPSTSYQPGLVSANLNDILPSFIAESLRQAFIGFGKKIRGYRTNDAQVVGVESRTSSPVRIPRDPETLEHPGVSGLYPCGEGAGYAGGIVSAAMDGERVAIAIAKKIRT